MRRININFAQIFDILLTSASILITIFAFFKIAGPIPVNLTTRNIEQKQTFDVAGEGSVNAVPNVADVSLSTNLEGNTVVEAQDRANNIINQTVKSLKALGIEEKYIKTQNYNIRPRYDYREGSSRINGYSVDITLQVKVEDFSKINQVIDTATASGVNRVGGLNFSLSDDKTKELEDGARKLAIQEAKEKAEKIAKEAGVKLGKVVNVTESSASPQPPVFYAARALDESGVEEPTQIEAGQLEVRSQVVLSYETL